MKSFVLILGVTFLSSGEASACFGGAAARAAAKVSTRSRVKLFFRAPRVAYAPPCVNFVVPQVVLPTVPVPQVAPKPMPPAVEKPKVTVVPAPAVVYAAPATTYQRTRTVTRTASPPVYYAPQYSPCPNGRCPNR